MKKYFIMDNYGDCDFDEIKENNDKDAIIVADNKWNNLSKHDQDKRIEFYLFSIDEGDIEDGIPNLDKVDIIKTYK